jgi:hypothetical protein
VRAVASAIALLAATVAAHADEVRVAPAAGVKLTYRLVATTTTTPDKPRWPGQLFTLTTGRIYTYIVSQSDGTTAEGVIKPNAVIIYCKGGASDHFCDEPAARPGAHFDGDLLTVPVDSDSGDALSTHSSFKLSHFLTLSRVYPMPSSRDPKADNHDFGPEPNYTITNTMQCDDMAKLDDLAPFGKAERVTLTCETGFERSPSRDGSLPPASNHERSTMEISHTGSGWVTVPSGSWQVEKYTTTMTREAGHESSESEALFSTRLGMPVRSHLVGRAPASEATTENTIELISVSR